LEVVVEQDRAVAALGKESKAVSGSARV
jgi:hypothetical protein